MWQGQQGAKAALNPFDGLCCARHGSFLLFAAFCYSIRHEHVCVPLGTGREWRDVSPSAAPHVHGTSV